MERFERPSSCSTWSPQSSQWLAEASFLSIEPMGTVYDEAGSWCSTVSTADEAHSWNVLAHFALKPYWIVGQFDERDDALNAFLKWKYSRPIFYRQPWETIELHGENVSAVVEEIRSRGVLIDGYDPEDLE